MPVRLAASGWAKVWAKSWVDTDRPNRSQVIQSRDRIYIFTRIPVPSWCVSCPGGCVPRYGPVRAVQAWKNLKRQPVGKYRTQYVYRCPRVECRNQVVEPVVRRAGPESSSTGHS